jgi:hypothetical protein
VLITTSFDDFDYDEMFDGQSVSSVDFLGGGNSGTRDDGFIEYT